MSDKKARKTYEFKPTIQFFSRHWNCESLGQGHLAKYWDQRASSFNRQKETPGSAGRRLELSQKIIDLCGLSPQSRMLDIGCGSGHYSLTFADKIGRVDGFDISPSMIEYARNNARNSILADKVEFSVLNWSQANLPALGWVGAFDLVLASRTPAVCDHQTLVKMMAASKNYCVMMSLANHKSAVRSELKKIITRAEETIRGNRSAYCAFNLLWLMGCYPEVSYLEQKWDDDLPVDEAAMLQFRHFEQGGLLNKREKELIVRQLEEMAVDGLVHDSVEACIALLVWKV